MSLSDAGYKSLTLPTIPAFVAAPKISLNATFSSSVSSLILFFPLREVDNLSYCSPRFNSEDTF
jgi:hypothetical protein